MSAKRKTASMRLRDFEHRRKVWVASSLLPITWGEWL
jgi:hypothetical protein